MASNAPSIGSNNAQGSSSVPIPVAVVQPNINPQPQENVNYFMINSLLRLNEQYRPVPVEYPPAPEEEDPPPEPGVYRPEEHEYEEAPMDYLQEPNEYDAAQFEQRVDDYVPVSPNPYVDVVGDGTVSRDSSDTNPDEQNVQQENAPEARPQEVIIDPGAEASDDDEYIVVDDDDDYVNVEADEYNNVDEDVIINVDDVEYNNVDEDVIINVVDIDVDALERYPTPEPPAQEVQQNALAEEVAALTVSTTTEEKDKPAEKEVETTPPSKGRRHKRYDNRGRWSRKGRPKEESSLPPQGEEAAQAPAPQRAPRKPRVKRRHSRTLSPADGKTAEEIWQERKKTSSFDRGVASLGRYAKRQPKPIIPPEQLKAFLND